jgi:hypothetical protein
MIEANKLKEKKLKLKKLEKKKMFADYLRVLEKLATIGP